MIIKKKYSEYLYKFSCFNSKDGYHEKPIFFVLFWDFESFNSGITVFKKF